MYEKSVLNLRSKGFSHEMAAMLPLLAIILITSLATATATIPYVLYSGLPWYLGYVLAAWFAIPMALILLMEGLSRLLKKARLKKGQKNG